MREYGFSLTYILPYKDKIYDFVLIRENKGQWKPVFSHVLCSVSCEFWEIFKNMFFTEHLLATPSDSTENF